MLNKVKTLNGYGLKSLDGEIGKVKDFYFDDRYWTIRYLVADTGNWLTGRQVLLSPYALGAVIKEQHDITIDLTKKQIENSPSLNSDKPVSKQFEISKEFEISYFGYYGYPSYWSGSNMWGAYPYIQRNPELTTEFNREKQSWDYHLRSTREVIGYHIQATDGEIGHIEDFIVDDETWTIRYLIIDTANWWSGKKILLSPQWIERVSWGESKVFVTHSRETIKRSPEYTDESLLTLDYETKLHLHYNRQGYWVDDLIANETSHTIGIGITHEA